MSKEMEAGLGEKQAARKEHPLKAPLDVSVVVPILERLDDLGELYREHAKVLSNLGKAFEFIFVLDGPNTKTTTVLEALKMEFPRIRLITLNRTFGEAVALSVGFEAAKAPYILTLSSYFQVNPTEVPKFFKAMAEDGLDLIISWRHPRIDSSFNRLQSKAFHWIIRMLTGVRYQDISCGVRLMRREVAQEVPMYGDLHRFFPLLAYQHGFKVAELPVAQSPHDVSRRLFKPGLYLRRLLDVLTLFFLFKFTKKPLRFFGLVGSTIFGLGAVITGYLGIYRILGLGGIADRPILVLGVLLLVVGLQLFSIGLLGELIIFTHARKMKDYTVGKILSKD